MLGSGCAFGGRFLAVALVEAVDASCGIDQLLLAGKERVASGTNFNVQVTFFGGASLERLAARAGDGDINVFWVYSWFHMLTLYRRLPGRDFKRDMIEGGAEIVKFAGDFLTRRRRHEVVDSNSSYVTPPRRRVSTSLYFFPKRHRQHTLVWSDRRLPTPVFLE